MAASLALSRTRGHARQIPTFVTAYSLDSKHPCRAGTGFSPSLQSRRSFKKFWIQPFQRYPSGWTSPRCASTRLANSRAMASTLDGWL